MSYLDFELEIGEGGGREYPVAVIRSAGGETRETMHFPFDDLALESRLKDLQIALLRSDGKRRRILSLDEQTVQSFGRALFNALFTGEVRSRYEVSKLAALNQGKGLRLKLRIHSPKMAALPWEFMYDANEAEYVCLSSNTPVMRYIELPRPPQPLAVTLPLHILGMTANPKDLARLDIKHEKQRVEIAIKDLRSKGVIELTWLEGQTAYALQRAMRGGPWDIFHFIGHGGFNSNTDEGLIALVDNKGKAHHLSATHLGRLLADHHSLRLVVLNSCEGARGSEDDIFSSTAAILVRRGIPAVLAMQYEITDRASITLSKVFYEALADGTPVDRAVSEARKAISVEGGNTLEWGTPVLYMRSPDGVLFDLIKTPSVQVVVEEPITKPSVNPAMTDVKLVEELPTPPSVISPVSPANPLNSVPTNPAENTINLASKNYISDETNGVVSRSDETVTESGANAASSAFEVQDLKFDEIYIDTSPTIRPLVPEPEEDEPDTLMKDYEAARRIREAAQGRGPGVAPPSEVREPSSGKPGSVDSLRPPNEMENDPFAYMEDIQPVSLPEQRGSIYIEDIGPGIPDILDVPTDIMEAEIEDLGDEGEILVPPPVHSRSEPRLVELDIEEPPRVYGVPPRNSHIGNMPRPSIQDIDDEELWLLPIPDQPIRVTPSTMGKRGQQPIIQPQARHATTARSAGAGSYRTPTRGNIEGARRQKDSKLSGWLLSFLILLTAGLILPLIWARVLLIGFSLIVLAFFINELIRRIRQ